MYSPCKNITQSLYGLHLYTFAFATGSHMTHESSDVAKGGLELLTLLLPSPLKC